MGELSFSRLIVVPLSISSLFFIWTLTLYLMDVNYDLDLLLSWSQLLFLFQVRRFFGDELQHSKVLIAVEWKVDRVLANQDVNSTASLLTSNIPFAWFPCDEM